MSFLNQLSDQEKMRIIQEIVPGKQITLAHIIANPDPVLYQKLGLDRSLSEMARFLNQTFESYRWTLEGVYDRLSKTMGQAQHDATAKEAASRIEQEA